MTPPTTPARILIVDDDDALMKQLVERLCHVGFDASGVTDPHEVKQVIARDAIDLVLTDVEMPGLRGPDLLSWLHQAHPSVLCVVMTAFGSIELAVQCVQAGASDFLAKPFPFELLRRAIERALTERSMRRELVRLRATVPGALTDGLVVRSPNMRRAVAMCERAARADVAVLLSGESGVGKTALARLIHASSQRAQRPFVEINCAALPPNLVESELFGVRRGAFTDAHRDRQGLFVEASGGTLFLDEVGELPLEVQPKLLKSLETGAVRAVGSDTTTKVDVRIVAATNVNLVEAVASGRFREDLYYRLHVIGVIVPPLRDRSDDFVALVDDLIGSAAKRFGRPVRGITADALRHLQQQPWPGNVRELSNAIERAVVLTEHDVLLREDFEQGPRVTVDAHARALEPLARAGWSLRDVEQAYIDVVLSLVDNNKSVAARTLGIDRRTLYRRQDDGEA